MEKQNRKEKSAIKMEQQRDSINALNIQLQQTYTFIKTKKYATTDINQYLQ